MSRHKAVQDRPRGTAFPTWLPNLLRLLLLAVSLSYVATYFAVVLLRIRYPFELEWMEGAAVDQVARILTGRHLYVSPSIEFIPMIYTPLFFYVSAGAAKLLGLGFLPLRLVSFAASVCSLALVYAFVSKETGNRYWGLVSAGLLAATFRASGAWFDIGRPDSLFLVLLLAGFYLIRFWPTYAGLALAGALLSLSFLAKQTALIAVLPFVAGSFLVLRRRSVALVLGILLLAGGGCLALNAISSGWFKYYVFDLPGRHQFVWSASGLFWLKDIGLVLPMAASLAAVYFIGRPRPDPHPRLFYGLALAGVLAAAWSGRLHYGGYSNVLFPAYAGLAVVFGLGAQSVERLFPLGAERKRLAATLALYLAGIAQFACLWYNPVSQIPTTEDLEAGRNLVKTIARIPGEVYMPCHGHLPRLAGKQSFAHQMAAFDILKAGPSPIRNRLLAHLTETIASRRFAAIILDCPYVLQEQVERWYVPQQPVFRSRTCFWPVAGSRMRPEWILVPAPDSAPVQTLD